MALSIIDPTVLPQVSTFMFVFAVMFGLMTFAKVGGFDRKVNAAVAIAIAAFAMLYEPLVTALSLFMPIAVGFLIVVFFFVFLKKVFKGDDRSKLDTFPLIISIVVLLGVMAMFSDRFVTYLPAGVDSGIVLWGIGLFAAAMFFWLIYKTPNDAV